MKEKAPINETKHEKFERLATKRTNAVLQKLRILGNLSNEANYAYSEEEIGGIFSAINKQLQIMRTKFRKPQEVFEL